MSEIFSGNTITIENLGNSKAKINKIGNSWQATRSGINKFDISKAKRTNGACSLQNNGDSIDVIATYVGEYTSANIDITDLFKEGETIYAIADFVASGSNTGAYRIQWAEDTGLTKGDIILMSYASGSVKSGVVPTKPEGATKLLLYLYGNIAGTVVVGDTVTYSKIMLSNQPITDYEPYGAMPSPEFPSSIENITDSAKIIVCNENLFDSKAIPEMSGTTYGVECKIDNNGIITLSSNTNPSGYLSTRRILRELCPKLKEGDVAYLFLETTHATKGIWLYNVEMMWSANTSKIITKEMLDGIVSIYGGNKQTDTIKIMITSNKLATEYKPHQSQTFLFPLKEGQKLYKDSYLADDGVHHVFGEKIFDGTEIWSKDIEYSPIDYYYYYSTNAPLNMDMNYIKMAICSHFKYIPFSHNKEGFWTTSVFGFSIKNETIGVIDEDDASTRKTKFKAYLAEQYANGTPVRIQYKLKNEVIEPYTPEQENIYMQLQNMELYEGINYVFVKGEPYAEIEVTVNKLIEDYDAYISATGRLIIPSLNINYLVDFNESNIPTMPEAVESSVRAAGRDGDIVLSTTYEPIPFNIVCYTEDNLTLIEKVEEEKKVNKLLNSIKNGTMTFALEKANKFYNVKYSGALTTMNYPKHLKFSIPLKSSESYGKDLIKKSIVGNSVGESQTAEKVGALFILRGPATNPMIALNDYSMEYNMSILEGARVEINSSKSTITNINAGGVKTNVMKYYNHQFPKIENGVNELKVLSGFDSDMQVSVIWNDLKL